MSAPDGGEESYPFALINDFVGGERFEIDLARNAAQRMRQTPADAERQLRMFGVAGALRAQPDAQVQLELRRERLEPRQIEGVEAEGTRKILTIPAGLFDNERPYEITHEEWYSPELRVVVLMRHDDPLSGETTYRLTNVTRGEPDRALFAPPAGVKITELLTEPPVPPSGAPKTTPSDGPEKKTTPPPVGR